MEQFDRTLKRYLSHVVDNPDSGVGKAFSFFLVILIAVSISFFIVETTDWSQPYHHFFHQFDLFVISVFALEYVIRFYLAPKKIQFVASPLAIVDLLVIASFYIALMNFSFLRSFRVLKILQLLKIFRYSETLTQFFKSFRNYHEEFKIFGVSLLVALVIGASGLYYLERDVNPDFATIPDSMWWSVVTVSTVGYGDAVPITWAGKVLAGFMMFMGLGVIAIFTAIITKMFIDHFFGKRNHDCLFCHYPSHDFDANYCKNCGNALDMNPRNNKAE